MAMEQEKRDVIARPVLKWAGGKRQLLPVIEQRLPGNLHTGEVKKYVEPFVGSGAVLFHLLQNYPIEQAFIYDVNWELINLYVTIQQEVEALITRLQELEQMYLPLDLQKRRQFYYKIRQRFNQGMEEARKGDWVQVERASQMLFLNRTCFNGLYRVNRKGEFNVPIGNYRKPSICDEVNLAAVHQVLQAVQIEWGSYHESREIVDEHTFVYFDPPYRPLNRTSSFNSYSAFQFADDEQIQLARYCRELDQQGVKWMLSNSDPQYDDPNDRFFAELYRDFQMERVKARRNINAKGDGRGAITELLITNY